MDQRTDRVANMIKELGALFLERESNQTSLISVTSCHVTPDLKSATLFISVLPLESEGGALAFAKRKRKDLRAYLRKNMKSKSVPFIDIAIDQGEKNRQRIDELLRKK
jgi:ribosome-binding factor A